MLFLQSFAFGQQRLWPLEIAKHRSFFVSW